MARPAGGPGKDESSFSQLFQAGHFGMGSSEGRGFPKDPGWGLWAHPKSALPMAAELSAPDPSRAAGAGRGAWQGAIRATPSRDRGARREAASRRSSGPGHWSGNCAGGPQQGHPQKTDPPPPPARIWFSHLQRPSRTKGAREGPLEKPAPLLTKAAASSAGQTREEGLGGRADTRGAPPSRGRPLGATCGGGERPGGQEGGSAPRGDQRFPPSRRRREDPGGGGSPSARSDRLLCR